MTFSLKDLWPLLKETASDWADDNAARLGAALAYYTVFALAPLLIVVLFIIGLFWSGQGGAAQAEILGQIEGLLGPEGAELVESLMENTRPGGGNLFAVVAGVVALFLGATGVFGQLQGALNTIWEVKPKPGRGIKGFIMTRLLSFGIVLTIGFLLLVALVVSAGLSALDAFFADVTPLAHFFFRLLEMLVSFGIITLLFAMIFRYLPDVEIDWRDVWIGAAITAGLFVLGKFAIGLYLGNSSTASAYGAAGSLVVLLLWVYYSAQILFFGAEFTQVYARRYGSQIRPASYAMLLPEARRLREAAREEEVAAAQPAVPAPVAAAVAPPRPPSAMKRWLPVVAAFFLGRWLKRG